MNYSLSRAEAKSLASFSALKPVLVETGLVSYQNFPFTPVKERARAQFRVRPKPQRNKREKDRALLSGSKTQIRSPLQPLLFFFLPFLGILRSGSIYHDGKRRAGWTHKNQQTKTSRHKQRKMLRQSHISWLRRPTLYYKKMSLQRSRRAQTKTRIKTQTRILERVSA